MAATELQSRSTNVAENEALSGKVAEQVSEILEEAVKREKARSPCWPTASPAPASATTSRHSRNPGQIRRKNHNI